ncbi:hypothetical protein KCU83_g462, partial [Aureobasidium melanogenum]
LLFVTLMHTSSSSILSSSRNNTLQHLFRDGYHRVWRHRKPHEIIGHILSHQEPQCFDCRPCIDVGDAVCGPALCFGKRDWITFSRSIAQVKEDLCCTSLLLFSASIVLQ